MPAGNQNIVVSQAKEGDVRAAKVSMSLFPSGATVLLLDGRTFNRSVRAKYTAIPWLGFEQYSAGLALVKKLAGIGRHRLFFGMTAVRTSNRRFENHRAHFLSGLSEDGYPAFFVASVNRSAVAAASSNSTVAVLLE